MKPEWTAENIKITIGMMKILRSETSSSRVHTIMQRAINQFWICLRVEQEEATDRAVEASNARASTRTLRELLDKYESAVDDFQKSTRDFRHTAFGTERRECDRREKGAPGDA